MPSFMTVLKRIAQLWDTKRSDLQEQVRIEACLQAVSSA
jgi:uncharacterized protein YyaL (SSP411 family)